MVFCFIAPTGHDQLTPSPLYFVKRGVPMIWILIYSRTFPSWNMRYSITRQKTKSLTSKLPGSLFYNFEIKMFRSSQLSNVLVKIHNFPSHYALICEERSPLFTK
jgi:hypothetical protein